MSHVTPQTVIALRALFAAMMLATAIDIAIGFGLCFHNVLFFVMPPEE